MDEQELFREALRASAPVGKVPAGFAEKVAATFAERMADKASPQGRSRAARTCFAVGVAAAVLIGFIGQQAFLGRRVEGEISLRQDMQTLPLGARATLVAGPQTIGRYAVGGVFSSSADYVELQRGAAFLRVEPGRPFEVRTPVTRLRVLGTCFRVELRHEQAADGESMNRQQVATFGAGAMVATVALVTVYEGKIRVVRADSEEGSMEIGAGESARVRANSIERIAADQNEDESRGNALARGRALETSLPSAAASSAASAEVAQENARLREYLTRNGISPETGQLSPVHPRRGIDERGETDLTPAEWRQLAERGELRFAIPGDATEGIADNVIEANGLGHDQADEVRRIVRDAHTELRNRIAGYYVEAVGGSASALSERSMISEVGDKTASDLASRIRFRLAQERGGLAPRLPVTNNMLPYERMMRDLVSFETNLESRLAEAIGQERAHRLLFGEPQISRSSFGMAGRP